VRKYPGVKSPPKPLYFKYPSGHTLEGTVIDEVYIRTSGADGSDYLCVIQKIRLPDFPRQPDIRFGYYRKKKSERRWRWGSQTTFQFGKSTTEKLLRKAIAKGFLSV
jgi:hypothetical protein